MSQSDIQQVLSDPDGTPTTVLTTAAFSLYPVTSVESYVDSSTSSSQNWAQSTLGIAVIATIVSTIVLLVVILFLYFLCTRNRQYRLVLHMARIQLLLIINLLYTKIRYMHILIFFQKAHCKNYCKSLRQ